MAEYEDAKLTSPDEHIKDTSTCESFHYKLAEGLLYNQGSKKDTGIQDLEEPRPGENRDPAPGWSLGGKAVPVVSDHTSGTSQHAEVSDGGRSTPAHPPSTHRVSMGPACPLEQFSTGKGQ
ncbi:unnamed protein product [Rangifer tarandus platyrhynchus]|uniref:Uncharacterized protein n=1 Tax=Rangifer tarandus platyrhynchus TaxID=3082113 RepID=A0AC59ZKI1_RANTA